MARKKIHRSRGYIDSFIPTGSRIGYCGSTAPVGWVTLVGLTIGSVASVATERANADCEDLFIHLWNEYADAECPVVGGRGASAQDDWDNDEELTLLDYRGRNVVGVDVDNGAGFAGLLSVAGCGIDGKTLGTVVGVEEWTLAAVESGTAVHGHANTIAFANPAITGTVSAGGVDHTHGTTTYKDTAADGGKLHGYSTGNVDGTSTTGGASAYSHGHADSFAVTQGAKSGSVSDSAAAAAANAHQNMTPSIIENCIIKL